MKYLVKLLHCLIILIYSMIRGPAAMTASIAAKIGTMATSGKLGR